MTAKEKARDLIGKFVHLTRQTSGANGTIYNSQQCALIALQEMIKLLDELPMSQDVIEQFAYLQEVKQEIQNL
jgi:hypothetical protein